MPFGSARDKVRNRASEKEKKIGKETLIQDAVNLMNTPATFKGDVFAQRRIAALQQTESILALLGVSTPGEFLRRLEVNVTGHEEEYRDDKYVTIYNFECQLPNSAKASEEPLSDNASESTAATEEGAKPWRCGRRLCDIREWLQGPLWEGLGKEGYSLFFANAPFAMRAAPPGTTERLRRWCVALAEAVSDGRLEPRLCVVVLCFLGAPMQPGRRLGYASELF